MKARNNFTRLESWSKIEHLSDISVRCGGTVDFFSINSDFIWKAKTIKIIANYKISKTLSTLFKGGLLILAHFDERYELNLI